MPNAIQKLILETITSDEKRLPFCKESLKQAKQEVIAWEDAVLECETRIKEGKILLKKGCF